MGCGCEVPQKSGRPGRMRKWCASCNPHHRLRKPRPEACRECGALLPRRVGRGRSREFCSGKCRKRRRNSARLYPANCRQCGAGFLGKRRGSLFCSRGCQTASQVKPPAIIVCRGCEVVFEVSRRRASGRVFCTPECRAASWKASALHNCLMCGGKFLPAGRSSGKFCSRDCAFAALRAGHPKAREPQKVKAFSRSHRQRCIRHGVPHEAIRRQDVFERDGWVCGICGISLLRKQRHDPATGRLDDRCPTIDHIVPLSLGPPCPGHVWPNVRAACRRCNMEKGDSVDHAALHSFVAQ